MESTVMKKSEFSKKVKEIDAASDLKRLKKMRDLQIQMDIENHTSNINRARSITVGTAFGGTAELMMRGDGGRHLWCAMQPVEVIELIYQLAANVGCNIDIKPRKDFSSWRDWRVSEAEKKHLNGHVPFVNDMAVFQKLGASGYDDEEAKRIMDILADIKEFANENDDTKVFLHDTLLDGAPNIMFGEEDKLIHNKLAVKDEKVLYVAGGNGGDPKKYFKKQEEQNETVATNKPANGRKTKRTSKAA